MQIYQKKSLTPHRMGGIIDKRENMLVISSSGFSNDSVFPRCISCFNKGIDEISIAIITTAAIPEKKENKWILRTYEYLIAKGIKCINYFDFEKDNSEDLDNYDIIFIAGGNPYYLFHFLYLKKFDRLAKKLLKKEKVIIAVSAGALFFCKGIKYIKEYNNIMGFKNKDNFIKTSKLDGISVFDVELFPHYDQFLSLNQNLESELRKIENRDNIEIYRLGNMQNIFIHKDKVERI